MKLHLNHAAIIATTGILIFATACKNKEKEVAAKQIPPTIIQDTATTVVEPITVATQPTKPQTVTIGSTVVRENTQQTVSNDTTPEAKQLFSTAVLPITTKIVKADEDNVIIGENNTEVSFAKNSLVNSKGEIVKGDIKLELKEANTKSDIVMAGLDTRSNGKTLETGGMLYIGATSNGEQLKLAKGATINIKMNALSQKKDFQLFEGEMTKNGINWKNPIPMFKLNDKDTIKPIAEFTPSSRIVYVGCNIGAHERRELSQNLSLSSTRLGWCNIDRFYFAPNADYVNMRTEIESIQKYSDVKTILIIAKSNLYLTGSFNNDRTIRFGFDEKPIKLPIGEDAVLLATGMKNNNFCYTMQSFRITKELAINLQLQQSSKDALVNILKETF